jgi:hypothetical protein
LTPSGHMRVLWHAGPPRMTAFPGNGTPATSSMEVLIGQQSSLKALKDDRSLRKCPSLIGITPDNMGNRRSRSVNSFRRDFDRASNAMQILVIHTVRWHDVAPSIGVSWAARTKEDILIGMVLEICSRAACLPRLRTRRERCSFGHDLSSHYRRIVSVIGKSDFRMTVFVTILVVSGVNTAQPKAGHQAES